MMFDTRRPDGTSEGWARIDFEFGVREPLCESPPYEVTLNGPEMIPPGEECTWTLTSNGGVSWVEWYRDDVLVSETLTYSGSVAAHMDWFELTVRAGTSNQTDSDGILVQGMNGAPPCT